MHIISCITTRTQLGKINCGRFDTGALSLRGEQTRTHTRSRSRAVAESPVNCLTHSHHNKYSHICCLDVVNKRARARPFELSFRAVRWCCPITHRVRAQTRACMLARTHARTHARAVLNLNSFIAMGLVRHTRTCTHAHTHMHAHALTHARLVARGGGSGC